MATIDIISIILICVNIVVLAIWFVDRCKKSKSRVKYYETDKYICIQLPFNVIDDPKASKFNPLTGETIYPDKEDNSENK